MLYSYLKTAILIRFISSPSPMSCMVYPLKKYSTDATNDLKLLLNQIQELITSVKEQCKAMNGDNASEGGGTEGRSEFVIAKNIDAALDSLHASCEAAQPSLSCVNNESGAVAVQFEAITTAVSAALEMLEISQDSPTTHTAYENATKALIQTQEACKSASDHLSLVLEKLTFMMAVREDLEKKVWGLLTALDQARFLPCQSLDDACVKLACDTSAYSDFISLLPGSLNGDIAFIDRSGLDAAQCLRSLLALQPQERPDSVGSMQNQSLLAVARLQGHIRDIRDALSSAASLFAAISLSVPELLNLAEGLRHAFYQDRALPTVPMGLQADGNFEMACSKARGLVTTASASIEAAKKACSEVFSDLDDEPLTFLGADQPPLVVLGHALSGHQASLALSLDRNGRVLTTLKDALTQLGAGVPLVRQLHSSVSDHLYNAVQGFLERSYLNASTMSISSRDNQEILSANAGTVNGNTGTATSLGGVFSTGIQELEETIVQQQTSSGPQNRLFVDRKTLASISSDTVDGIDSVSSGPYENAATTPAAASSTTNLETQTGNFVVNDAGAIGNISADTNIPNADEEVLKATEAGPATATGAVPVQERGDTAPVGVRTVELIRDPLNGFGFSFGTSAKSSGVLIMSIASNSVAEKSGSIYAGDNIMSINGVPTTDRSHEEVMNMLRVDSVVLELISPSVMATSPEEAFSDVRHLVLERSPKGILGFSVKTMKGYLGQTATNIIPGGAADKAGIKEDDVLIAINGKNVLSSSHIELVQLLRSGTCNITVGRNPSVTSTLMNQLMQEKVTDDTGKSASNPTSPLPRGRAATMGAVASFTKPLAVASPTTTIPSSPGGTSVAVASVPSPTTLLASLSSGKPLATETLQFVVTRLKGKLGMSIAAQSHHGAVVVNVVPGGAADIAGLKMGDIIRSVDGLETKSTTHAVITASLMKSTPMNIIVDRPISIEQSVENTVEATSSLSIPNPKSSSSSDPVEVSASISSPEIRPHSSVLANTDAGVVMETDLGSGDDASSGTANLIGGSNSQTTQSSVTGGNIAASKTLEKEGSVASLASVMERLPLPPGDTFDVIFSRSSTGSLGLRIRSEESRQGSIVVGLSSHGITVAEGKISVGDYLIAVNGASVLEMNHAEVVIALQRSGDRPVLTFLRSKGETPMPASEFLNGELQVPPASDEDNGLKGKDTETAADATADPAPTTPSGDLLSPPSRTPGSPYVPMMPKVGEEFTFPPEALQTVTLNRDPELGFGLRLRTIDQRPGTRVLDISSGGPAAKSGIVTIGAVIYSINGENVVHSPHEDVANKLRALQVVTLGLVAQDESLLIPPENVIDEPAGDSKPPAIMIDSTVKQPQKQKFQSTSSNQGDIKPLRSALRSSNRSLESASAAEAGSISISFNPRDDEEDSVQPANGGKGQIKSVIARKPILSNGASSAYNSVVLVSGLRSVSLSTADARKFEFGAPKGQDMRFWTVTSSPISDVSIGEVIFSLEGDSLWGKNRESIRAALEGAITNRSQVVVEVGVEVGPAFIIAIDRGATGYGMKLSSSSATGVSISALSPNGSASTCPVLSIGMSIVSLNDVQVFGDVSKVNGAIRRDSVLGIVACNANVGGRLQQFQKDGGDTAVLSAVSVPHSDPLFPSVTSSVAHSQPAIVSLPAQESVAKEGEDIAENSKEPERISARNISDSFSSAYIATVRADDPTPDLVQPNNNSNITTNAARIEELEKQLRAEAVAAAAARQEANERAIELEALRVQLAEAEATAQAAMASMSMMTNTTMQNINNDADVNMGSRIIDTASVDQIEGREKLEVSAPTSGEANSSDTPLGVDHIPAIDTSLAEKAQAASAAVEAAEKRAKEEEEKRTAVEEEVRQLRAQLEEQAVALAQARAQLLTVLDGNSRGADGSGVSGTDSPGDDQFAVETPTPHNGSNGVDAESIGEPVGASSPSSPRISVMSPKEVME